MGTCRSSHPLRTSSTDDPSATYEEETSPDASSAGFCPGSPRNSVFSWFLLLVTHQERLLVTAARMACSMDSLRLGDVASHPWALELGMNLTFWPHRHSPSARARTGVSPVQCPLDMARKPSYRCDPSRPAAGFPEMPTAKAFLHRRC